MQARFRSSGDGTRGHGSYNSSSNYRSFGRGGGFNRGYSKPFAPPPPPPPRKADILMEAGRLAAEYLVSKGILPASALQGKHQGRNFQESSLQDREPEGRTSALARLGSSVPDSSNGRRRLSDDYNNMGSKRGRRKGPYGKYGSEWTREIGRNGPWTERGREYSHNGEQEDDFAPGYYRDRRGGSDDFGSNASRVAIDERPSKSEVTGESGSENYEVADDTGSKAGSSSTKKGPVTEVDGDLSTVQDDVKVSNVETGEEEKIGESGDVDKMEVLEELDAEPSEVEVDTEDKNGSDLLKFCSFAKVPTRPRSSLGQRSPKFDQVDNNEASKAMEVSPAEVSEVVLNEDLKIGSSGDLQMYMDNSSELPPPNASEDSNIGSIQHIDESLDPEEELGQSPPGFELSPPAIEEKEDVTFAEQIDKREDTKRQIDSSAAEVPEDDGYSLLQNVKAKQPSSYIERISPDEQMMEAVDPEKVEGAPQFSKVEDETDINLEEEKQLASSSFKICDLNLIEAPEITDIPNDSVMGHLHASDPTLKPEQRHNMNFGLTIGNNTSGTDDYSRLSGDNKVVQIIDLDDDSPMEESICSSPKPKNEAIYSSLENFLSHTDHTDDLQDGYSLAISELLGTDMSGCSAVPPDLNNLQGGMGSLGTEGVPGDDDAIYVSLGEIPIGFMEVWDQPPQEFGKFF